MRGLISFESQDRFITKYASRLFKKSQNKISFLKKLSPLIIVISSICYGKTDEPFQLYTKDVYTYYGIIAINSLGALGWIFTTWWSYKSKLQDKTQDTLDMLVKKMDEMGKDLHFLSLNSVSKADVTDLVREEIAYREELRGR